MTETVLDVVDDFTRRGQLDVRTAPGTALDELARTIQQVTFPMTPSTDSGMPVWLGGWPSANFWAVGGDMLLSSLLYSPAVVVKDPISDWFSMAQYAVEHMVSARPGHYDDPAAGVPNIPATRAFLSNVLPALEQWRPLIDTGVVKLVPSAEHHLARSADIEALRSYLEQKLLDDPVGYARQFSAAEMATEDNVRGMFLLAGGDQENQLRRAQGHALRHFAREYLLARSVGADYTAPFRHEQHLCRFGLGAALGPSERVVHALVSSHLPILTGLTPAVVAKVRDDPNIAQFRHDLHQAYQGLPVDGSDGEVGRYLHDQELHELGPIIDRAERDVDRGPLRKLGVSLSQSAFGLAVGAVTGVGAGLVSGDPALGTAIGVAGNGAQVIYDAVRGRGADTSSATVWRELTSHHRTASQEMLSVRQIEPSGEGQSGGPWGIADDASMSVTVTAGELIFDHHQMDPITPDADGPRGDAHEPVAHEVGVYRRCECGSGRKYKFCCRGLPTA